MNFLRNIINLLRVDRTNWKSIALCFIVALIFWLFNALNKDYATNIQFPVQFDFDTSRYVSITPLPDDVLINIEGNGWDILKRSFNVYSEALSISLDNPKKTKEIAGTTLPAILTSQIPNFQINHIITDTLHLDIDTWATRKIKITIDPKRFTYATGFGILGPVIISADSVEITGPKSKVDAFSDSILMDVSERNLDDDFSEIIKMKAPDQIPLKYRPDVINITFKVVKWEQVKRTIRLDIINTPLFMQLELVKDSIDCVFQIPEDSIEAFQQITKPPTALLDLQKLSTYDDKVWPRVIDMPAYAKLLYADSITLKSY